MDRMRTKRWFHLGFVGWLTTTGLSLVFMGGLSKYISITINSICILLEHGTKGCAYGLKINHIDLWRG
jgi:hypothetical protein